MATRLLLLLAAAALVLTACTGDDSDPTPDDADDAGDLSADDAPASPLADRDEGELELRAFLVDGSTEEGTADVRAALDAADGVRSITFEAPDDTFARAAAVFADDPEALAGMGPEDFPAAWAALVDEDAADEVLGQLRELPDVASADALDPEVVTDQLRTPPVDVALIAVVDPAASGDAAERVILEMRAAGLEGVALGDGALEAAAALEGSLGVIPPIGPDEIIAIGRHPSPSAGGLADFAEAIENLDAVIEARIMSAPAQAFEPVES